MDMVQMLSIAREMRNAGIDGECRRNILSHPEKISDLVAKLLLAPKSIQNACMQNLGLGDDIAANFRKHIVEKNFYQSYDLFRALELFFYLHYEVELAVYILDSNLNGEILIGNQNTYRRDIHLGKADMGTDDFVNERRCLSSGSFESSDSLVGDGGKWAVIIPYFEDETVLFTFGDMKTDYMKILRVWQGFMQGNMSQLIRMKIEYIHKIYRDPLTGLYNREYFNQVIDKHAYSIINIDINNFKTINDTFGHAIGDKVLVEVAEILQESIRKNDKACRFWGDEFILLVDVRSESVIQDIIRTIHEKLGESRFIQAFNEKVEKKIGIAAGWHIYARNVSIPERLWIADRKMYENKMHIRQCISCGKEIGDT